MIKLPVDGRWSQPGNSDKFGSIWASKNINLDEDGYVKLSPRTITMLDEASNSDFGVPVFIGRFRTGQYHIPTAGTATYYVKLDTTTKTTTAHDGSGALTLTANSDGIYWNDLLWAAHDTTASTRAIDTDTNAAWTSRISSGLTAKRHPFAIFHSRQTLCVGQSNTVRQYNTSYTNTINLTIPADFEVVGLAYNGQQLGVITRLGDATDAQNLEAFFFLWDGSTTSANASAGVGSDTCLAIIPYRGSFAILTRAGQLLYWTGGGFQVLANFAFWYENKFIGAGGNNSIFINNIIVGNHIMYAEGDVIYINMPTLLEQFTIKQEQMEYHLPTGVWCYDPKFGLYHRWSPSRSVAYLHSIAAGSVNISTDLFTTSATIPATGNIARITGLTTLGGFTLNKDYYIVKVSSTTFRLATTRANALASIYIDVTSVSGTTTMWLYDLIDYAISLPASASTSNSNQTGALTPTGETSIVLTDILIGGKYFNTSLSGKNSLCVGVPYLENRGYIVTPKIFSSQITDSAQSLTVKFRPLKTNDAIVVKFRNKDIDGLPIASTGNPALNDKAATWSDAKTFYTTQDLSEAKTYFDNGGELECELVAGAGAGYMLKIDNLTTSGTNYIVSFTDNVFGVAATNKSEFIIHNWEIKRTITSDDVSPVQVPLGGQSSWMQFKIELRGSETTLEELQVISIPDKLSV